jgi:hypothetical protein
VIWAVTGKLPICRRSPPQQSTSCPDHTIKERFFYPQKDGNKLDDERLCVMISFAKIAFAKSPIPAQKSTT